jgi:hypothetical protein
MYACDYFHRSVETFPEGQLIFINFLPTEVCSFKVGLGLYRSFSKLETSQQGGRKNCP